MSTGAARGFCVRCGTPPAETGWFAVGVTVGIEPVVIPVRFCSDPCVRYYVERGWKFQWNEEAKR